MWTARKSVWWGEKSKLFAKKREEFVSKRDGKNENALCFSKKWKREREWCVIVSMCMPECVSNVE